MYRTIGILLLSTFLLFLSCEKTEEYSNIPEITFVDALISDTIEAKLGNPIKRVAVKFKFIDGDGDLGLSKKDTFGDFAPTKPYYYNLKFSVFEKKNNQWVLKENTKPYFRFLDISKKETDNNVLKGYMIVNIDFLKNITFTDTLRLDFFIYDRALHQSNTESTHEIYLYE